MTLPWPSRLFWKLLASHWLSMLVTFSTTFVVMYFFFRPDTSKVPIFPVIPLVTGALVMVVAGFVMAWHLAKPLKDLGWAFGQVSAGHFDTRIQPRMGRRKDEIADLASKFDAMAERLQQLTESRRVLLHDISHELRSPLTRMQAAIGLVRQSPARMPEMLERIDAEVIRLDELVSELLTLHRIEAGTRAARERVDVLELLHAIVEDADFEARAHGRWVNIDAPGSFVASVNGELIYRAFENVIRNAVRFSPPGQPVMVSTQVRHSDGVLLCQVLDRGPGVAPEQLSSIFEPFNQLDGGGQSTGFGLGLAIAQRALQAHAGRIDASLRDGGGLCVTLCLPSGTAPSG